VEQGRERDSPPSFHMPRFRIPIIDIIFRSIRKFTKSLSIPNISVVPSSFPRGNRRGREKKIGQKEKKEKKEKKEGLTNEQEVNQSVV
jgi:hypothetical protein